MTLIVNLPPASTSTTNLVLPVVDTTGTGTGITKVMTLAQLVTLSEGPSGARGLPGVQGPSGPEGPTGPTGATGPQGDLGYTGSFGYTGSVGYTGSAGKGDIYKTYSTSSITIQTGVNLEITVEPGLAYSVAQDIVVASDSTHYMVGTVTAYDSGSGVLDFDSIRSVGSGLFDYWEVNLEGAVGPEGPSGPSGPRGDTGLDSTVPGPSGPRGYTGSKGDTGSQGSAGYIGSKGDTGNTGPEGYTGSVGYVGSRGLTGYNGSVGGLGYTGSIGYVGSKGDTGAAGSTNALTFIKTYTNNYTPTSTDHGYYIRMNNTTSAIVTLVSDATDPYISTGTTFIVGQVNIGSVTFAAGAGASVYSPGNLTISGRWGKVSVIKTGTSTWEIDGALTV